MTKLVRRVTTAKSKARTARRVIAYLRVSTDQQADSGLSLEAQRAKLEGFCALKDLQLVDVVVDAGASAKTLDRPGLTSALARIHAGEADALLVTKLDRLTRSLRDLAELLEHHFAGPASLLCLEQDVDTSTAAGRMVLNLLVTVAQWEREAIGERTRAALTAKRARGEAWNSTAPYGWQYVGGRCLPCPTEHATIRRAIELRDAGHSLAAIASTLTAEGHRSRAGKPFARQSIHSFLRNTIDTRNVPTSLV